MNLFDISDDVTQVVRTIEKFYHRYHSMRYVDKKLVIRLQRSLSTEAMAQIEKEFQDLLVPGGRFLQGSALPEESGDLDTLQLPRLILDFNRSTFARLKALIDALNRV